MRAVVRFLFGAVAVLTACGTMPGAARAEHRVALVVGIDAYPNLGADAQLKRAVADADSVSAGLRKLGFSVTTLSSGPAVTQDYFERQFSRFEQDIQPGDIAVFYFAGHGLGLDGANYLAPADMPELVDANTHILRNHALAEAEIRDRMQRRGPGVVLLMLDAYRNNPFRSTDRGLSLGRGLQPVQASKGVLTIYAAGYGQTALDRLSDVGDPDPNSVFTRVVVSELARPGISLVEFSEDVRDRVDAIARQAGREQVPAIDNQLVGGRGIYLAGPPAGPAAPPPTGPDEIAWSYIQGTSDAAVLRQFLSQFPDSGRRSYAQARLASLDRRPPVAVPPPPPAGPPPDEAAWQRATSSTLSAEMRAFVDRFPGSSRRPDAEEWLRVFDDTMRRDTPGGDAAAQRHYLELFPAGSHSAQARILLARLERPRPPPEPARSLPVFRPRHPAQSAAPHPSRPHRVVRPTETVAVREAPPRLAPHPVGRLAVRQEHRRAGGCFTFAGESHCQ